MPTEKDRLIATISPSLTAAGPTRNSIPRSEVIQGLELRIAGTATEAGVADGTLTSEGTLSLLRNVRVEGTSALRRNVGVIRNMDAAAMYRLYNMLYGYASDFTEITPITKSSAASPFSLSLPIPFEMPHSEDERHSVLNGLELDSLDLNIDWGDPTDILSTGTWAFNTLTCEVTAREFTDKFSKDQRYSIHKVSYQEAITTSANTRLAFSFNPGFMLRGILFKQFTRTAYPHTPVETVINSVALELDRTVKKEWAWNTLQAMNARDYGVAIVDGYAFLDLMPKGRYDTLLDTSPFKNVEAILNVNGVANSYVRAYAVEMIPANQ